ncbi:hypothetical protein BJ508DRAFT_364020 [Ascobolus immersus RN42]|uniref:Uncharacterized protein n=1 Tax=Ascobolus immersus RN42 TaxID=1160509 RepID=A0A3N4HWF8_ASCIM|nr:hypothetical protein BJ508DRAFT_364020 [Ascobolus immersus RN42]
MRMKFHTTHPSPFHDPRYAGHKTKPLLYTLKNNTNGLGVSPHSSQVDQWWERAFDKQLNDMKVNTDGKGITVTSKKSEMVLRATGRWISFVSAGLLRGGNMVGEDEEMKDVDGRDEGWETEPPTGTNTPVEKETKEEKKARRLRRAEKRKRKEKREERRKKRKTK